MKPQPCVGNPWEVGDTVYAAFVHHRRFSFMLQQGGRWHHDPEWFGCTLRGQVVHVFVNKVRVRWTPAPRRLASLSDSKSARFPVSRHQVYQDLHATPKEAWTSVLEDPSNIGSYVIDYARWWLKTDPIEPSDDEHLEIPE